MIKSWLVYTKNLDIKNTLPSFIEEGFSFKAMFFSFFWFVYYGLWLEAAIYMAAQGVISLFDYYLVHNYHIVFQLALMLLAGQCGSRIRELKLLRSGYKLSEIIVAKNIDKAKLSFYKKYMESSGG